MKRSSSIFLFFIVCFFAVAGDAAQTMRGRYQTIQFGPGYLQKGNCNINGVAYPVGQDNKVWGQDVYGNPWVIGWVQWQYNNIWTFHGVNGVVANVPCW